MATRIADPAPSRCRAANTTFSSVFVASASTLKWSAGTRNQVRRCVMHCASTAAMLGLYPPVKIELPNGSVPIKVKCSRQRSLPAAHPEHDGNVAPVHSVGDEEIVGYRPSGIRVVEAEVVLEERIRAQGRGFPG